MAKKPNNDSVSKRKFDFQQKETQKLANNILANITSSLKTKLPDVYWNFRSQEDQDDRGIDMEYELIDRFTHKTLFIFKLQNKGSRDELKPLSTTVNKGLISFPLTVRKARYYFYEINVPLLFIVCDTKKQIVYWHPIQLDDSLKVKIRQAEEKQKDSLQIYIDPQNILSVDTVERFLLDVKESFNEQVLRFNKNLDHPVFAAENQIRIDKTKHLLDQLYEAMKQYFEEFSHIRPSELLKLYPFRLRESGYTSFYGFTATVDSKEVVELFNKIKYPDRIADEEIIKIPDYQEKSKTIINTLFVNGIEYIASRHFIAKTALNLSIGAPIICDCCECAYIRFDFGLAFKNSIMLDESDTLDLSIKKAYIQYKLCNYTVSATHFLHTASRAKKEQKWITYSICLFNLKNLKAFVKSYFFDQFEQKNVLDRIAEIDFDQEFSRITTKQFFGKSEIQWIINEKFFSQTLLSVSNIIQEIEKHYYSQIDGGWSSNSNGTKLLSELFQIAGLLNRNYIVFDHYRDFDDIMELATKGYIASYSMHTSQSRLVHFNINVIQQLLLYSKPENIITYFDRFFSKAFITSHDQQDFLYNRIVHLLNSYSGTAGIKDLVEIGNSGFIRKREVIFENACVLAALFEMNDDHYQGFVDLLISTHRQYRVIDFQSLPYFQYFLAKKGERLTVGQFQTLLELSITDSVFHNHNYIGGLTNEIKSHFPTILVHDKLIPALLSVYSNQCPACKHDHPKEIVLFYWFISPPSDRKIIEENILTTLRAKFDPSLFYTAAVFKIIDHSLFINDFLLHAIPDGSRKDFQSIFSNSDSGYFSPITKLVDLLYLFNYDLKDAKFNKYRNFSPYYRWLFDLNGFNYTEFDPVWLLNHPSAIFLNKMKLVPQVKAALKEFLKNNNSPVLTRIYLDYLDA